MTEAATATNSPAKKIPQRYSISHPIGNLIGMFMGTSIILLFMMSYSIDWGVGWMVWVPAAILVIPASALMRRRVLIRREDHFDIEHGWLMRRARSFYGDDFVHRAAAHRRLFCRRGTPPRGAMAHRHLGHPPPRRGRGAFPRLFGAEWSLAAHRKQNRRATADSV